MMTLASLIASGFHPTQARIFVDPLATVFALRGVDTPERQAAFVAQAGIESEMFTELEELLWYRDAARIMRIFPDEVKTMTLAISLVGNPKGLANTVYAGRNGNGNYLTGDGFNYRGRGFGLTGRANYAAASAACGRPYVEHPELVSEPPDACLSFAYYWTSRGCNEMADRGDIDAVTRAINGRGMQKAIDRKALYTRALQSFR